MAIVSRTRYNCWNCGKFIWSRGGHYYCTKCEVRWSGSFYEQAWPEECIDHSRVHVSSPG